MDMYGSLPFGADFFRLDRAKSANASGSGICEVHFFLLFRKSVQGGQKKGCKSTPTMQNHGMKWSAIKLTARMLRS